MECTAFNGPAGTGVYAVASCCAISGLRCQAHASPEPGQDAQCAGPQHHLTGNQHAGSDLDANTPVRLQFHSLNFKSFNAKDQGSLTGPQTDGNGAGTPYCMK